MKRSKETDDFPYSGRYPGPLIIDYNEIQRILREELPTWFEGKRLKIPADMVMEIRRRAREAANTLERGATDEVEKKNHSEQL